MCLNEQAAIATQLALSFETYRMREMAKLGLTSQVALVRYTLEHGWLHAA